MALDAARSRLPGAVLLDVGMPRMDGFAFAEAVPPAAGVGGHSVVAVTGHTVESCRARGWVAGIDYDLLKPIDPGVLRGWRAVWSCPASGRGPAGFTSRLANARR